MKMIRLRKGAAAYREYARGLDYDPKDLLADSGVSDVSAIGGNYFVVSGESDEPIEDMGWLFKDTGATYDTLTAWTVRELELYRRKKDSAVFVDATKM